MRPTRICKDCAYHEVVAIDQDEDISVCTHSHSARTNLVTGEITYSSCTNERYDHRPGWCGYFGKNFVSKHAEPQKPSFFKRILGALYNPKA